MKTLKRNAQMHLDKTTATPLLRVSVPSDVNEAELAVLNRNIIENVIKGHTGCSCLSGRISVLLEGDFQEVINVNLAGNEAVRAL